MGYPMTMQRVLRRNSLLGVSYGDRPGGARNTKHWDEELLAKFDADVNREALLLRQLNEALDACEQAYRGWGMIAGDLNRLVDDVADEHATCAYIADRIGVDKETVAAVLKEMVTW